MNRRKLLEDEKLWQFVLYNTPVTREPNKHICFRFLAGHGDTVLEADITLGANGWFENHSNPKASKTLLILGGEQTASTTVDISWPYFLGELLAPHGWRVINMGWPDAGPEHYLEYFRKHGKQLNPDLVLVNLVETDFFRGANGAKLTYQGRPVESYTVPIMHKGHKCVWSVSRQKKRWWKPWEKVSSVIIPSIPFGLHVQDLEHCNSDCLYKLQEFVLEYLMDICSWCPEYSYQPLREFLAFDNAGEPSTDRNLLVKKAAKCLKAIQRECRNMLVMHNFNGAELNDPWAMSQQLEDKYKIPFTDMRKYIPLGTSDKELDSWYQGPYMPEKWSQRGHEVYANMIRETLVGRALYV